ncbi:MAG: NADH-quinone oxidoreductase subunit NuoH [Planctomycetota bacterium]
MLEPVTEFLRGFITPQLFVSLHVLIIIVHVILVAVAYLVYFERKISAYIQDRLGPNRVGFDFGLPFLAFLKGMWGLGQPLADGVKFLVKEDYAPTKADKALFTLAPIVIIVPALIGFAVIPWGGKWEMPDYWLPILGEMPGGLVHFTGAHVNIGIIYLLAVASLGVYGVTLGGWASNSKYSFLGGMRASAQMISYEIPLGMSLLTVLLMTGSLLPYDILEYQKDNGWMILAQPIAAVLFFIAILAEANRAPFDNAEAEQELVGGYHTEYSSMRFALFFLAEYAHLVTSGAFFVLLFLGGWQIAPFFDPFPETATGWLGVLILFAQFGVYLGKVVLLICFMMVIRWTLPRLRYDQIMQMAWQGAIPIALAVVVMTSVMMHLDLRGLVPMLAANIGLGVVILGFKALTHKPTHNRKIPLYGSRFSPMPGTAVATAPSDALAFEDRPVQGTAAHVAER